MRLRAGLPKKPTPAGKPLDTLTSARFYGMKRYE
jgi:hypothetical protein